MNIDKLDSLSKAVYVSEQVFISWHRTGAYYASKLTFSPDFPVKVWGAYYQGSYGQGKSGNFEESGKFRENREGQGKDKEF